MESILDDIDAMIGELDDIGLSDKKKKEDKTDAKDHDIKSDGESNDNFKDLINDLAAFNPTPVSKPNTLKKEGTGMTEHTLVRGGSLRARTGAERDTAPRKGSVDSTMTIERRRGSSLSRQNSGLDSFSLLPSPSENIKIYMNEGNIIKTIRVERSMTAWDLCLTLALKNELDISAQWTLVEEITNSSCERTLEDHESVVKVYKSWGINSTSRFSMVLNEKKFLFLEQPEMFFSGAVLDRIRGRSRDEIQEVLTEEYFSERAPPIEGYLYFKDQKHSWARKYFLLRSSGLYYSTKGKSRAPQDLACFTTLQDVGMYFCVDAKVDHKAPTEHAIAFKPPSSNVPMKDLKCVAAESEDDLMRWYHALRVVKFGDKIPENRATVLLEVTQEIERIHEQRKQAAEEAAEQARNAEIERAAAAQEVARAAAAQEQEAARLSKERQDRREEVQSPRPQKTAHPPLMSPKPSRSLLNNKPVPSPRPEVKKALPVPPTKPKPVEEHLYMPLMPTPKPVTTKPQPPPQKPAKPEPKSDICTVGETKPERPFTPNKTGFAAAQAQLARSLRGTIKRGNSVENELEAPLEPPKEAYQPRPPSPAPPRSNNRGACPPTVPRPISPEFDDDLPPPPPDFLVEQPLITNPPAPVPAHVPAPVPATKISDIVKTINSSKSEIPVKPAQQISVTEGADRTSSVSALASQLNRTLKKSNTTTGLNPAPRKPMVKPGLGALPKSNTCSQICPEDAPNSGTSSSVQKRAADLANIMGGRPLNKPPPAKPLPNKPPPMQPPGNHPFTRPGVPPQVGQHASQHPPQGSPQSRPPRPPPSFTHPPPNHPVPPPNHPVPPPNHPVPPPKQFASSRLQSPMSQPMKAPPPCVPPSARYPPQSGPVLHHPPVVPPSRKDSIAASRQRTTSGSSAGSSVQQRPGSAASQVSGVSNLSENMRPPPRTVSRDNLRARSGSRENLAMNTASTLNTTSEHGIPDIFKRPTNRQEPHNAGPPFLGQHNVPAPYMNAASAVNPGPPGSNPAFSRPNIPVPHGPVPHGPGPHVPGPHAPGPLLREVQEKPPNHPLHFPPQRYGSARGRESPAKGAWHDSLMQEDNGPRREGPMSVNIQDIRQQQQAARPIANGNHPHSYQQVDNNWRQGSMASSSDGYRAVDSGYRTTDGYRSGSNEQYMAGSGDSVTSEEVMYEYIEDTPSKTEHLHSWLNSVTRHYPADSESGDSASLASEVMAPPRSDSRRDPGNGQPWFHGGIPREVANSLLASHGLTDGLFLVRASTGSPGDFVLSMSHDGHVKHFQITQRGGTPPWYAIEDGPAFPDVAKLVEHYSTTPDRLPFKLACYCLRAG